MFLKFIAVKTGGRFHHDRKDGPGKHDSGSDVPATWIEMRNVDDKSSQIRFYFGRLYFCFGFPCHSSQQKRVSAPSAVARLG